MAKTTLFSDDVLNTARAVTLTAWTPYFGLISAITDLEAGTVTELSYTGYARQLGSFGAPGAGQNGRQVTNDAVETFPAIPVAEGPITVLMVGIWDALTVGQLNVILPINPTNENQHCLVNTGDLAADTIQSAGHGYANDDRILVRLVPGCNIPTGLSENTLYYVHATAADTFELSTAAGGGSPIDITAAGEFRAEKITPVTFNDNDVPEFGTGAIAWAED